MFGCNVHKLAIDAGFTCPNRDGHVAIGGCIYCDGRGSKLRQKGALPSVAEQIASGKKYYKPHASKYIAYFQTFTNTYAPVEKLQALYDEALAQEDVIGLSIGTRPDCLGQDVIELLSEYAKKYHIWLELGLQSVHDKTLQFINRGHNFQQFLDVVNALAGHGLNICVHIIIGLPNENEWSLIATLRPRPLKTLHTLLENQVSIDCPVFHDRLSRNDRLFIQILDYFISFWRSYHISFAIVPALLLHVVF